MHMYIKNKIDKDHFIFYKVKCKPSKGTNDKATILCADDRVSALGISPSYYNCFAKGKKMTCNNFEGKE